MKKVWIAIGSVVAFFIVVSIIIGVAGRANRGVGDYSVEEVAEVAEEVVEEMAEEEAVEAAEEAVKKMLKGRITFYSDRDGDLEIYIMDSDGENVVQLTDNDSDNYIIGGWK